jgi:hypothetical protein
VTTVLTAQTRITTDRAGRYLVQLCQHLNQISGHARHRGASHGGASHGGARPQIRHVEWSDSHGVIEFASGQCTLDATGDALTIDLAAADTDELREMQQTLAARLKTIGRRDNLVVTW